MNCILALLTLVSAGWVEPDVAEPPTDEQLAAEQAEFARWAAEAAAGYEIRLAGSPDVPLVLRPEPVLKWSNPERGRIYGHVFVWTAGGRPEAIASLYKWYHPFTHSSHEFQSLSTGGLSALREGSAAWSTTRPGVEPRPLAEADPPANTAAARLRQMRDLVRDFRANETNRAGEQSSLRCLPQPIYRYESTKEPLVDGALFAFVQATDPEIVLLLEARKDESGKAAWHYALARLNSITLRVFYQDREVWTAQELPWSVVHDQTEPYFTVQFR
ncbi:MAG TPA: hypothetical protein VG826_19500 [Pirellulales bacterium]|nr:hypothetical protein [Pirellulales bacterium]